MLTPGGFLRKVVTTTYTQCHGFVFGDFGVYDCGTYELLRWEIVHLKTCEPLVIFEEKRGHCDWKARSKKNFKVKAKAVAFARKLEKLEPDQVPFAIDKELRRRKVGVEE